MKQRLLARPAAGRSWHRLLLAADAWAICCQLLANTSAYISCSYLTAVIRSLCVRSESGSERSTLQSTLHRTQHSGAGQADHHAIVLARTAVALI